MIASVQPNFDALWGGADGMYAQRLGADRALRLNPLALLASQGVPLAFGSDTPVTSMNPWATVRAATRHRTAGSAVSARAAFAAATRGAWRAGGVRDGVTGTLVPGAPASYAVWETGAARGQRPGRRGAALVDRSAITGARAAEAGADARCRGAVRRFTAVRSSMAERTARRGGRRRVTIDGHGPGRRRRTERRTPARPTSPIDRGEAAAMAATRMPLRLKRSATRWWTGCRSWRRHRRAACCCA